ARGKADVPQIVGEGLARVGDDGAPGVERLLAQVDGGGPFVVIVLPDRAAGAEGLAEETEAATLGLHFLVEILGEAVGDTAARLAADWAERGAYPAVSTRDAGTAERVQPTEVRNPWRSVS